MSYEELRYEFNTPSFKQKLKEEKGCKCIYCGCEDEIEFHHIIPLSLGGDNRLSNIIPLCRTHHFLAHNKCVVEGKEHKPKGRKPKYILPDEKIEILHRYFNNEIGTKETKELLGLSPKNKSTLDRMKEEYKTMFNVPSDFYNNVDLLNSQKVRIEKMRENKKGNKSK